MDFSFVSLFSPSLSIVAPPSRDVHTSRPLDIHAFFWPLHYIFIRMHNVLFENDWTPSSLTGGISDVKYSLLSRPAARYINDSSRIAHILLVFTEASVAVQ